MRVNMGREGRTSSSLSANGGTMLGALILANGPSQPLEAATKYYVDTAFANLNANNVVEGVLPISSLPGFTGDATSNQGSNSIALANLGVTPGSYAKVIVDSKGRITGNDVLASSDIPVVDWSKIQGEPTTLNGYGITGVLTSDGGTFTGQLSLTTSTLPLSAANKQYVDSSLTGNAAVVGDIIRKPYSSTPVGFLRCNGGVINKTTYADLYAVIGNNFDINTESGSGKPWQQQYNFNTTQSGDIVDWVAGTALPGVLTESSVIVTKNRVYLLGGNNGAASVATVYTAPINVDGTLGAWTTGTALPGLKTLAQVFVTRNRAYICGGYIAGGATLSSVYTAPINSDGTLGTWVLATALPAVLMASTVLVTKSKVYLLGGSNGTTPQSAIYVASINDDGSLGAWSTNSDIPVALSYSSVIVTKNRVYLIGGRSGSSYVSSVYFATINADGTIGTWSTGTSLPGTFGATHTVVTKNRVYLLGGNTGVGTVASTVYTAPINTDGTLGTWTTGTSLPGPTSISQAIITSSKVYLLGRYNGTSHTGAVYVGSFIGGANDYSSYYQSQVDNNNYVMPGSGRPWQQQYQINTSQSAVLGAWSSSTALINGVALSQAVVTKNRVYLIGGLDDTNTASVYVATINTDGTLGTWTTDTALPNSLYSSQAIVTKNRVYLLGGRRGNFNFSTYLSVVYTAPINVDGTLGAWTTGTSLPGVLSDSQAIVTKNRVYLLGGKTANATVSSVIYTAPINTDGTLGTWTTSGLTLPVNLCYSNAVVTKNRVYLCGGSTDSNNAVSTVYTAYISSDGILGTWSTVTSLPGITSLAQTFITSGRVYICGGYNGTNNISTVYTAPINADGTLGAWTTDTALPISISETQLIATNNNLYLFGGFTTGYKTTVYTLTISGSVNDYSGYYDGSINPISAIDQTNFFALPDFSAKEKNGVNIYIKY